MFLIRSTWSAQCGVLEKTPIVRDGLKIKYAENVYKNHKFEN